MKIQVQIVADSLSPQGKRLTTLLITFPRFILAELNTHRMLSKNSASSRAIPTHKLLKMVEENPFIPIAWQKEHKGMQGTEYFTEPNAIDELNHTWFKQSLQACDEARYLISLGATKQIANRLLEPFMWHTVLISGTEWENFFELRCPQYSLMARKTIDGEEWYEKYYRSWKDLLEAAMHTGYDIPTLERYNTTQKLKVNKGQAEIHMMALAEAMWDAMNESTPKQLQAGEWHIPFGTLKATDVGNISEHDMIRIATARCARTSYTVVGDEKEVSYETLLNIHDKMAVQVPFHASPFEHCARAMDDDDFKDFLKGEMEHRHSDYGEHAGGYSAVHKDMEGWCRNYRGFIQYRHILESDIQM